MYESDRWLSHHSKAPCSFARELLILLLLLIFNASGMSKCSLFRQNSFTFFRSWVSRDGIIGSLFIQIYIVRQTKMPPMAARKPQRRIIHRDRGPVLDPLRELAHPSWSGNGDGNPSHTAPRGFWFWSPVFLTLPPPPPHSRSPSDY